MQKRQIAQIGGSNMKYTVSYEKNGVYQAVGVNAQAIRQAFLDAL